MDEPPALDALSNQVAALSASQQQCEAVADITLCSASTRENVKPSNVIRRGFLDRKPRQQLKGEGKEDHIPMIKPKAGAGKGPSIPDFLMVEPDETTKKLEVQKQQLLEAIKPTEKSISTVMQTPELAQGFDDPEIMKAVEEIAKNPSLIQTKYANNVKVAQFYQAMAGHVGQQLTALGGAGKKVS